MLLQKWDGGSNPLSLGAADRPGTASSATQLAADDAIQATAQYLQTRAAGKGEASSAAPSCEYRDMLIYRSASNGDEVAFLADDTRPTVLQASLEVYAPLTNSSHLAANLAQSLSEVILDG